jgi:hypothetical protein
MPPLPSSHISQPPKDCFNSSLRSTPVDCPSHKVVQNLRTACHKAYECRLSIANYSTAHMQVCAVWVENIEHLSTLSIIYGLWFSLNSHINVTNISISYPRCPVLQQSPTPWASSVSSVASTVLRSHHLSVARSSVCLQSRQHLS